MEICARQTRSRSTESKVQARTSRMSFFSPSPARWTGDTRAEFEVLSVLCFIMSRARVQRPGINPSSRFPRASFASLAPPRCPVQPSSSRRAEGTQGRLTPSSSSGLSRGAWGIPPCSYSGSCSARQCNVFLASTTGSYPTAATLSIQDVCSCPAVRGDYQAARLRHSTELHDSRSLLERL